MSAVECDAGPMRSGRPSFAEPSARVAARHRAGIIFNAVGILATLIGLATLVALVWDLVDAGAHLITPEFFLSFPSSQPERAGILSAWVGSIFVILTTAGFAIPLGVAAGLYLEEYAPKNLFTSVIEIAVNNLAAVPSIIFGLLALGLFVQAMGLGQTILTGGLTLALLILPIVIVATREAVRAVPQDLRQAALALGATKWRTTHDHVLPNALPGVVTGVIIGLSRAIGETAPLIVIGGLAFVAFLPVATPGEPLAQYIGAVDQNGAALDPLATETVRLAAGSTVIALDGTETIITAPERATLPHGTLVEAPASLGEAAVTWSPSYWLQESFTAMPIQMFNWTSRPQEEFRSLAAAAGLVLLTITLVMNGLAIWLRYRLRRRLRW
jgi:phosphate transport system permease protein